MTRQAKSISGKVFARIAKLTFLGLLLACSSNEVLPAVEYYNVPYRKFPPEPVYSRVTWSHLPQPIQPKVRDAAPILMPVLSFELPKSNLEEAVEALAQTIGYGWDFPAGAAKRPVRIRMVGTVEEILKEISRQTKVKAAIDHSRRLVQVFDTEIRPELPAPKLPGVVR